MAKPKPGGRRPRKKERKNVTYGVAHIKSSFNNTIVTITDTEGNVARVGVGRQRRVQGLAQVDAVRRPAGRREGGPRGHGARRAPGRGAREGPGLGPRDRHPLDPEHRHRGVRHQGRDAGAAQRLPPAEATEGLHGSLHRSRLPAVPPRADEALPQGHQVRLDEVPDRAPPLPAGRARPVAPAQQGSEYLPQLREKQKARRIYGLMEKQFRNLYDEATRQQGVTGENLLRLLETAPRQRRLPRRLGLQPRPGPPARAPRPREA